MGKLVTVTLPESYWERIERFLPGADGDETDRVAYWTIDTRAKIQQALFRASQPAPTRPATVLRAVPDNWTDPRLGTPAQPDAPTMEMVYITEPMWVCPQDGAMFSRKDRDKYLGFCPNCQALMFPERTTA